MSTTAADKFNVLPGKWQSVIVTFYSNPGKEGKVGLGHRRSWEQRSWGLLCVQDTRRFFPGDCGASSWLTVGVVGIDYEDGREGSKPAK